LGSPGHLFYPVFTRSEHEPTEHPTSAWVTQQARQLCWKLEDRTPTIRYLLHDHDAKFPLSFDQVFAAQQVDVIRTPIRAPNANAFAERWVHSVRQECLNHLLIVNERHLKVVLHEYSSYYNRRRPHQGLEQHFPETDSGASAQGAIRRRDILRGIIHDYYRDAA
jgi:putative transposase